MSSQLQVTGKAKIRDIQGPVVANSGVITALDGDASQYVRGDGTLADFPTSTGGGSSVSYYLNSSVSQGTIGGVAYRQLGKTPIIGAGTDIAISTTGYIASYITDANDPALLEVPAGNFNCEFYFSVNSNAHNPFFYAEVYKYDGSTFSLIGTSVGVPEYLSNGTTLSPYYFAIPVSQTVLTITDRIAIRIYVNVDGRTVTLHTENGHLCQVVTTFSKGLTSLNNLTRQVQFLATGTSGTDFNISSTTATHTFNIPSASETNRGLITTGTQTIAGAKTYTNTAIFESSGGTGLKYGAGIYKGFTPFAFSSLAVSMYADATTNNIIFRDDLSIAKLLFDNSTQTYTFPAATGTIALTSNLSSYVPYTGATANVNLGGFGLSSSSLSVTFFSSFNANILLKKVGLGSTTPTYVSQFAASSGVGIGYSDGTGGGNFILQTAAIYDYTFPAASGTIALTSNLSSYLPLAGGTLTGPLNGTNATFSGLVNAFSLSADGGTSNAGQISLKHTGAISVGSGYVTIAADSSTTLGIYFFNSFSAKFSISALTANRTYTLPDATGTIALLSGTQTFTGATTFSLDILVNSIKIGNANGSDLNTVVGFGALSGTGVENTAVGYLTLSNNTTGNSNTAVGKRALISNTTASWNTAIGAESLFSNTTGNNNTAIGYFSLNKNTTGASNTALGSNSLRFNTTGVNNTAIGISALESNTTGAQNVAIGTQSLQFNTTSNNNTAIGHSALGINTGAGNTAIGYIALSSNTTGSNNVAVGNSALNSSTTSNNNTAIGVSSLTSNTTGTQNTAIGINSGVNNTTGSGNSFLGYNAGAGITTGGGNTIVGNAGTLSSSLSNNIILADGNGNIRYQWNGTNNVFGNPISGTSATFSGNVSLGGSTIPSTAGNALVIGNTFFGNTNGTQGLYSVNAYFNGTNWVTNASTSFQNAIRLGANGVINFHIASYSGAGTTMTNWDTSDIKLSINPSGNVGIGTNSPLSFTSYTTTQISNTAGAGLFVESTTGSIIGQFFADNGFAGGASVILGSRSNHPLVFTTNNTERMRITSEGNVTIGLTASNLRLGVRGADTGSTNFTFYADNGANPLFTVRNDGYIVTGTEANSPCNSTTTNVANLHVFTSNGALARSVASSKRFKENITDWEESGIHTILSLKPKTFTYKKEYYSNSDIVMLGLIAEEVAEVSPYLADYENEDRTGQVENVRYATIVVPLIKAVQELNQKGQEQQAQIEELKELIKNK